MSEDKPKSSRGFALLTPEERSAIARAGGIAAHATGRAHKFTPEEASAAGKLGGAKVSQDAARMAELGRKGGKARAAAMAARKASGEE